MPYLRFRITMPSHRRPNTRACILRHIDLIIYICVQQMFRHLHKDTHTHITSNPSWMPRNQPNEITVPLPQPRASHRRPRGGCQRSSDKSGGPAAEPPSAWSRTGPLCGDTNATQLRGGCFRGCWLKLFKVFHPKRRKQCLARVSSWMKHSLGRNLTC